MFDKRWKACYRIRDRFEKLNNDWLQKSFQPPDIHLPNTSSGRPKIPFSSVSEKTKRRRTELLRKSIDVNELTYAAQVSLKEHGKEDEGKLLKEATTTTPTRAHKIRNAYKKSVTLKEIKPYSVDEALALVIDTKLTKSQYTLIRLQAKNKNANLYPSYNNVREAKSRCYPEKNCIFVSEISAEVKLQGLLDHTIRRICQSINELNLSLLENQNLILISKWGFDGTSGKSQYKQKFSNSDCTDSDIFLSSLVPILLCAQSNDNIELKNSIWKNPKTSSTKYCRPIRLQLKKETTELTRKEFADISDQIKKLKYSTINQNNKIIKIKHEMVLSMIDGKVCNAICENSSSQVCNVCLASPKDMNQIEIVQNRPTNSATFNYGLSTLHAWIRFFECLLHVGYRLDFLKWQARGDDKIKLQKRKKNTIKI